VIPTASPEAIDGPRPPGWSERLPWGRFAAAAAIILVIVGSAYAYLSRPTRDAAPDVPATSSSQTAPTDEVPVATTGSSVTVGVNAVAPCWLSLAVDGETSKMRLLPRGESFVLQAEREVTLRAGDGGALRLTINGHPARPLGGPGEPVTTSITPDNYRDYLAAR
jgi:hypothetical protein